MFACKVVQRAASKAPKCCRRNVSSVIQRSANRALATTAAKSHSQAAAALCRSHGTGIISTVLEAPGWPLANSASFATSSADSVEEEDLANSSDDDADDEEEDSILESSSRSTADGIEVVVRRRNIRGSWKKMNYLTRLVGGMYALDALEQMAYTKKRKGIVMRNLINLGAVRALQDHDIPIERLKIERAMVNKGPIAKRGRFHARGRTGKNYHRYSHLYLSFREVEPKSSQEGLPSNVTRTPAWSSKPQHTGRNTPGKGRAARRAANAAANAAALGGRLAQ